MSLIARLVVCLGLGWSSLLAVTKSEPAPIRINCGATNNTTIGGVTWEADRNWDDHMWWTDKTRNLQVQFDANTLLHRLDRASWRGLTYYFDLDESGTYSVNLYFSEFEFRDTGMRVFDILINDEIVDDAVDVFELTGGRKIELIKSYQINLTRDNNEDVSISNNSIEIHLAKVFGATRISAIEITAVEDPILDPIGFLPDIETSSSPTVPPTASAAAAITTTSTESTQSISFFNTIRVNVGASEDVVINGITWGADRNCVTEITGTSLAWQDILGTDDDILYQSDRYATFTSAEDLVYKFDVPNGFYGVSLYFSETYFVTSGMRVFDISLNDVIVWTDLDLFDSFGYHVAVELTFENIEVMNGVLTISLLRDVENPVLSGIKIEYLGATSMPTTSPVESPTLFPTVSEPTASPTFLSNDVYEALRVNCGLDTLSYSMIDSNGNEWIGDSDFVLNEDTSTFDTGASISNTNSKNLSTVDEFIYQTERSINVDEDLVYYFEYVLNSFYDVTIHLAEIYFVEANLREIGLEVQGIVYDGNIDLVEVAGAFNAYAVVFEDVEVSDGSLLIQVLDVVENPKISGIEIVRSIDGTSNDGNLTFLNCGAFDANYVDKSGNLWVNDELYLATDVEDTDIISSSESVVVEGGIGEGRDTVYRHARVSEQDGGELEYIVSGGGAYEVSFLFAEIESVDGPARVIEMELEGEIVLTDFSIFDEYGLGTAVLLTYYVSVQDDALNIVIRGVSGKAIINGLFVTRKAGHLAHAVITCDERPYLTFEDLDDDGVVSVFFDGSTSHTHDGAASIYKYLWQWRYSGSNDTLGSVQSFESTATTEIAVGTYDLFLTVWDTFENSHTDVVTLDVMSGSGYIGCLAYYYDYSGDSYDDLTSVANFLLKVPDVVTVENNINFAASDGSTFANFGSLSDNLAAQYLCYIDISSDEIGTYYFGLKSDDGAKLFVENELVINNNDTTDTVTYAEYELLEGRYHILIEYYSSAADGSTHHELKLMWQTPGSSEFVVVPSDVLKHGLYQQFAVIDSISPDYGTNRGGNTVTLTGSYFWWDMSLEDVSVVIVDELGGMMTVNSSDITWSDTDTSSMIMKMPAHDDQLTYYVETLVYILTPAGWSNGIKFTYQHDLFDAPAWNVVHELNEYHGYTVIEFGPDGKLYASDYQGEDAADGILYRFELAYDLDTQTYSQVGETLVSDALAQSVGHKATVLGIAFNPNDDPMGDDGLGPKIYVSHGKIYAHTGVTGYVGTISVVSGANMENVEHLVTNLPVSDHDHSVNGIAFAPNGIFYICVGGSTNAGVEDAWGDEMYFSGAVVGVNIYDENFDGELTYDANGFPTSFNNGIFVYSSGVRNCYDLAYHPKFDALYATDNGPNAGYGVESVSCDEEGDSPTVEDELNKLEFGSYHGHPNKLRGSMSGNERECFYYDRLEESDGEYTGPIGLYSSSTDGVAWYDTNNFGGQWRDDLLLGRHIGDMNKAKLDEDGETVLADTLYADGKFVNGLDVIVDYRGSVFMALQIGGAIRYVVPDDDVTQYTRLHVVSVRPKMGPLTGGTQIKIRGYNFGSIENTIVKFGYEFDDEIYDPVCDIVDITVEDEFDVILCTTPDFSDIGSYGPVRIHLTSSSEGSNSTQEFIFHHGYTYTTTLSSTPRRGVDTWIPKLSMPIALKEFSMTAVDTTGYYVFGGVNADEELNSVMYKFDIASDEWIELTDVTGADYVVGSGQVVEVYDGDIYCYGGSNEAYGSFMKKFDAPSQEWTLLAYSTFYPPFGAVSGVVDDVMYVAGGVVDDGSGTNQMLAYDIANDMWSELSTVLPDTLMTGAGVGYDGNFYVFGRDGSTEAMIFDGESWQYLPSMEMTLSNENGARVVEMDGELIVFGAGDNVSVQAFNLVNSNWRYLSNMVVERYGVRVSAIDNVIFVAGGVNSETNAATSEHQALAFL